MSITYSDLRSTESSASTVLYYNCATTATVFINYYCFLSIQRPYAYFPVCFAVFVSRVSYLFPRLLSKDSFAFPLENELFADVKNESFGIKEKSYERIKEREI